ncbi:hypothetical protein V1291_005310 [Nitrobacteraceae bacterium AZCC 1564]
MGLLDYFGEDTPLFGRVFGGANSSPPVPPAHVPGGNANAPSVNGQQPKQAPFKGALIPMRVDENGSVSFDSDAGLLGSLRRAFTLPGDVKAGRFNIEPGTPGQISDYDLARQQANNDEIFRRGMDFASFVTLKPAPTVVPLPYGVPNLPKGARITDVGPHGPIVEGLQGRFGEAVKWLRDAKTGDVKGVLSHPELPGRRVDLVHGTRKYGLDHIDDKHPGALDRLPEHWEDLKIQSDSANRTQLRNGEAKAVVRKDLDGEPKDWLLSFYRFEDPPRGKSMGGAPVSGPASLDRRTLPNVGPYEPIIKKVPLAPYQLMPYSAAHFIGDAVQRFSASPSGPQQQSEESAFRFDDLPNGKRTGGAAVSGPASPNRQTEANVSSFESAHKAVPFASYQSMPYSAARLSGQTFDDQARVLRLVPPQGDLASTPSPRPQADQSVAASAAPSASGDISELLKLRAIVDAMGSRGLFPIQ